MHSSKQQTARQIEKIKRLLKKLHNGQHVQNRDIKIVLNEEQFEQMEKQWSEQKDLREELKNKPEPVKRYEKKLKKALFTYNKASTAQKQLTARRLFRQADIEFENLLEYLQEIIFAEPELRAWFDRDTNYTVNNDNALSPVAVPRVVTSKSLNVAGRGFAGGVMTKGDVKIQALEHALSELENDTVTKQQKNVLKNKLAKLKQQGSF